VIAKLYLHVVGAPKHLWPPWVLDGVELHSDILDLRNNR
jgi:hypothetical protein